MKKPLLLGATSFLILIVVSIGIWAYCSRIKLEPGNERVAEVAPPVIPSPAKIQKPTSVVIAKPASTKPLAKTGTAPIKSISTSGYPTGQRPDFLGGEEVAATISAGGKNLLRSANQRGSFGRIVTDAKSQSSITLAYPSHGAQTPVIVEAEDGGVLQPQGDQKAPSVSQLDQLDGNAQVTVNFVTGTQPGIYRVTFRHGADLKQIDFWVGSEPAVSGVASK